jgi:diaminohydroxyphosphoribosylaminopyrimidine deaminase/5-amino-6-(5-phosphoribosylamino)uracil reductase
MVVNDEDHMSQALALARRGLGLAWPNPAVGCVVVRPGGEIAGRGWTAPGGRPHAEAIALERAGSLARNSTVYVTLEPCAHTGRGAPCSAAIVAAEPTRVVVAMGDPDPRTAGHGIAKLRAVGIEVREGVLSEEAFDIVRGHVLKVTEGRPAVTLKLALGTDGLVPKGHGTPSFITGEGARAHAHLLRARADAILVGRGTVRDDNPSLTCRLPGMSCRSPVRVVLDSRLRTPPTARLFEEEMVPVWIVCADGGVHPEAALLQERGAEIIPVPVDAEGLPDMREALRALALRGITGVLVEGGPCVAKALLDADLVDTAVIYQSSKPAGDALLPFASEGLDRLTECSHFTLHQSRSFGPDRMTSWRRKRPCSPALSPI